MNALHLLTPLALLIYIGDVVVLKKEQINNLINGDVLKIYTNIPGLNPRKTRKF
jgi:hypothetical protein